MKVAVIGTGNVGIAIAADLSINGHDVTLVKSSLRKSEAFERLLKNKNHLWLKENGEYKEAYISRVSNMLCDIENAEVVIVTIQSIYHDELYKNICQYLRGEQVVLVICSYLSSFYLAKYCQELPSIAEATGPYLEGRVELDDKPDEVVFRVGCRLTNSPLSVFHEHRRKETMEKLKSLYVGLNDSLSVIESALLNPNLVIHTCGAVMSIPRIEYSDGNFCMYREAYSHKNKATLNVMFKLDEEKKKVLIALNSRAIDILEAVKNHSHQKLCIVNGFMYYYELFFMDKVKLSIYAQDPYCHLLYMLANGKVTLKYKEKLSWLEDFNSDAPSRQLALALYAEKLQKFSMSESSRNDAIIESVKMRAKESIEKTEKGCERLMRLLTTCEYHIGTLQDAIPQEKVIFFNYGKDKTQKRTFKLIAENSDLEMDFNVKRNDYYEVIETLPKESYFYYFSNSPYLSNMHKLAMWDSSSGERWSAGRFLYCNKPSNSNQVSTSYKSNHVEVNEIAPPADLTIDNPNSLKIVRVSSTYLHCLQKKYIKKVDQCSMCTYAFVVMYEKFTLGGFGFTLPQHKGYDLFQLTDFCTNNDIPRLAKLILLCIQTAGVQIELSRRMHKLCEKVISCAYTHKPVSMKYRGVYQKVKEHCTSSYLAYEGELGKYKTNKEVIEKYQKMLKNGK